MSNTLYAGVAAPQNIVTPSFADFNQVFKFTSSEPIDFSGATVRMQLREQPNADQVFLEFTTEDNSITITDTDELTLYMPAARLKVVGLFFYDLKVVYLSGETVYYLRGTFELTQSVTR